MNRGFSLVELSIVLVILGLLTGGILAGQSLIKAAELRAITSELSRYSAAVYTFRDKYFALPGDMSNAFAFWGTTSACTNVDVNNDTAGCNGNGDGRIFSGNDGETSRAWQHLANAGLIEGNYSGIWGTAPDAPPSRRSGGVWMMKYWAIAAHGWGSTAPAITANQFAFGTNTLTGGPLSVDEAWNLDMKLDDGKPTAGAMYPHTLGNCTTTTDWATAQYNLTVPGSTCTMLMIIR